MGDKRKITQLRKNYKGLKGIGCQAKEKTKIKDIKHRTKNTILQRYMDIRINRVQDGQIKFVGYAPEERERGNQPPHTNTEGSQKLTKQWKEKKSCSDMEYNIAEHIQRFTR
jgi:hypothetical protein